MGVDHDKTTSWETSVDPGKVLVGSSDSPRQNGMEVKSLHALAKTPLLLITPAKITIFGQKYLKCLCGLFVMGWSVSICVRTCSYGLATSDVPLREIRE